MVCALQCDSSCNLTILILGPDHGFEPPYKRKKVDDANTREANTSALQEQLEILDALRFEQIDDRFLSIKPCHMSTCRWLLTSDEYLAWMDNKELFEHHGFFWIKGKPGSGKSTLTKFALTRINQSRAVTVLSFFFNARGSQLEKSTAGLYRSMLLQILEKSTDRSRVWDALSLSSWPSEEQLRTNCDVLKDLLHRIIELLVGLRREVYIVIDALDECDEDQVRDMVSFFSGLGDYAYSQGSPLRVMFSSRHYPYITIERSTEMNLEDQNGHSEDIDKYILSELRIGRGTMATDIRQRVADRACGVFMWVVLVVQILNKAFDHGHVHALKAKLAEIPDDLNELFRNILTRDCQNMDEMKICLQWILYSNRPLRREELYNAILAGIGLPQSHERFDAHSLSSISTEAMDRFILSSSKGLAEIAKSKQNHVVQFIHESVRDFLLRDDGLSQVWTDLSNNSAGLSHERLKICCSEYLTYATHHLRHNIRYENEPLDTGTILPPASSDEGSRLRKEVTELFPFLTYAVSHVFRHSDSAQARRIDQRLFIKQFNLFAWCFFYNALQRHQVNRLPEVMDIDYIFAEQNCAALIGLCVGRPSPAEILYGRYVNPISAAIAHDNAQAFDAFARRSIIEGGQSAFPYSYRKLGVFLIKHIGKPLVHKFLSKFRMTAVLEAPGRESTMLSWAIENKRRDVTELLIIKGPPDATDSIRSMYSNALRLAVSQGDDQVVRLLLDHGRLNRDGQNLALKLASLHGHLEIVKLIRDYRTLVFKSFLDLGSALSAASSNGHLNVIEVLLDGGAEVNGHNVHYNTALYTASERGHSGVVELLLARGAKDQPIADGLFASTALYIALVGSHGAVAELLLTQNAHSDEYQECYGDALVTASISGLATVVELLLDRVPDTTANKGHFGQGLLAASNQGHEMVVQLLLDRVASIHPQDEYFSDALLTATCQGHKEIVRMLLHRGADPNHELAGCTPLTMAAYVDAYSTVRLLLDSGAHVNAQPEDSALCAAASQGCTDVMNLLLDRGAAVNAPNAQYGSALCAAVTEGHVETVRVLLNRGADINMQVVANGAPIKVVSAILARNQLHAKFTTSARDSSQLGLRTLSFSPQSDVEAQIKHLEQQSKKRLLMARQAQDLALEDGGNHVLQDYQMQLMLLEQQNKERLLFAKQKQDISLIKVKPSNWTGFYTYENATSAAMQLRDESIWNLLQPEYPRFEYCFDHLGKRMAKEAGFS